MNDGDGLNIAEEVSRLQQKVERRLTETYAKLSPWQKTQVARHPDRPHCLDYIEALVSDFQPLAGDRNYGEDAAIIGGIGRFKGRSVMIIGQEKGRDTETRVKHNFGMARPEGYRKARRLMEMANRFGLPIVTLVDTAGAYPGVGAEERGKPKPSRGPSNRAWTFVSP
jgi:acetyl-CoA carboxylase carboxyl transferase subunit alpha